MLKRICLGLALVAGVPVWAQSTPPSDPSQSAPSTDNSQAPDTSQSADASQSADVSQVPGRETPMELPPPVTGQVYPSQVGSDVRRNYLGLGVSAIGGWDDNVLAGYNTVKTSSGIYTIQPYISFDKKTAQTEAVFRYNPGFTFYSQASKLNETEHDASGTVQYRVTPHFVFRAQDYFQKASSMFSSPYPIGEAPISGSLPLQIEAVIAQFADRIVNTATVDLGLQTSENTLIGAEGSFAELDYPSSSQTPGLYNSNSIGASGFYTHRVSEHQYLGFIYQYLQVLSYLPNAEGEASLNTFSPFYSFYLLRTRQGNLTASVQAGLQHSSFIIRNGAFVSDWSPVATASIGWQGPITNFAVSYTRAVSAGGGLVGLYRQSSASASAQWKIAHKWNTSVGANYITLGNDSPQYQALSGGHTIYGSASVGRAIGKSLQLAGGYSRIHESYPGIAAVEANPDSNRVYGSVSYQFTRPVGR